MYQNWSQSKLYLEALINDQLEMHIKNIFKTRFSYIEKLFYL